MKRNNGKYAVKRTNAGLGFFALEPIPKGKRIIEYTGPYISNEEVEKRNGKYFFGVNSRWSIDGSPRSNLARYINHSCDPNCEAIIEKGKIWIYAKKNIQPGVELAYDYQYERTTKEDEKFYECHCGSPKCRGTIMKPARKRRKRTRRKSRA